MNIEEIKKNIEAELNSCKDMKSLNDLKVKYLGKKGIITELSSKIKEIPNEEKKEFGMKMNELKTSFNSLYDSKRTFFEEEALNEKLASESIDVTLPATHIEIGSPNILEKLVEDMEELFMSMGYDVIDGPEIEEDKYKLDLWKVNEHILRECGVKDENIINLNLCTSCNSDKFHSYRKHNKTPERIGTILQIK